jgi:alkanesulfonate monooxygenase SsuD/methylene tetrahydromethanopterin reductase-like flavin-dependent oxidoreductase (luciferase family)
MSPNVLDRICRWDGWIVRPTSHPTQIAEDLAEIDAELGRRGTSRPEKKFTVAHENFCWLSEKSKREAAVDEQKRYMLGVVSDERPWDYIEAVYLTGTIDDIQRRIQERIDAGVEEIFLHTMTADLGQLDLFAEHILKPFAAAQAKVAS